MTIAPAISMVVVKSRKASGGQNLVIPQWLPRLQESLTRLP